MMTTPNPGLTSDKLQLFATTLAGLAPDEMRKAKLLFLKNELSQLRAIKSAHGGFGVAQGCFAIIPFFWPILAAQRSMMNSTVTLHAEQIRNALSVWGDDLGPDAALIEKELNALS